MDLTIVSSVLLPTPGVFPDQGTYDLVDLPTVHDELRINNSSRDTSLLRWITQASAQAAKYCDREFPIQVYQDQVYPARDYFPAPVVKGNLRPLQLSRWPIAVMGSTNAATASPALTPPPLAAVLSSVAGGTLSAASYYVKISYVTATGETAASAETAIALAADLLLQVASPALDTKSLATGWNVYIGSSSYGETKQNTTPIAIGTAFTLPTSGLITGTALPPYVLVIENEQPLAEGVDFICKFDVGQLVRLDVNGWPKHWPALPLVAVYAAGYVLTSPKFADVVDAVLRLIKGRYYGQERDPAIRSENVVGAYEASYATTGGLSPEVQSLLGKYRVPVVG
jgi:hypothetical protein